MAADELAVPNWVLVPLFARVRAAGRIAASRLATLQHSWKVPAMQATIHAGEEFYRLSGGLRRIHEALEFGLLGEGDRIGHALALGWPVERWCDRNRYSVQPREERLWDLAWELERYRCGDLVDAGGRAHVVGANLEAVSRELFGEALSCSELLELRRRLFDPQALHSYGYPYGPRVRELDRVGRYLVDPELRRRAKAPIEVPLGLSEEAFLSRAQAWLRSQLSKLTITIETNPSSNLIIGDFGDFRDHPTFALSTLDAQAHSRSVRLPVSINSDDPLTFASCLSDEYAYLEAALVGRQIAASDALRWLDEAREAGWISRFSLPASADPAALNKLLKPRSARGRRVL